MTGEPTIKVIENKERFIRFEIDNINYAEANMIRRTLVNDIPKLAIDKVVFRHGQIRDSSGNVFDSSLPLFDEMVAHRIGLIPLKTDLKMNFRDDCICGGKGCSLCTVTFNINKTGPSEVTSADLLPFTGNTDLVPTDMDIPIVKLGSNQALLVTAEAYLGRGSEHVKWQVTSGVSYKIHREYFINKADNPGFEVIKSKFPGAVVSEDSTQIVLSDDVPSRELMIYINRARRNGVVNESKLLFDEDESRFIFHFETDGSIPAELALDVALKRIPERLTHLLDSISFAD
ncbi:MAG: DNA-directed RNA polymerase subunit D [Candidatus Thermoplasmatota archaeon]|jgi:DNA-directed RNA polymerase subunit D|nr:DNA-directed RNA polymerase subunit D [Candidatus Thermoplasmatota archaeon]MCL5987942.1 DNA-directed RNA polymerase subunit D [Candidatus Thermoplasmatota archaeon]